jgi:3-hydroxypropanoate dehydrogenase
MAAEPTIAAEAGALALDAAAQDLLFRQARTPHTFTDEPVTDETVRAIFKLAKYGPTSANGQPLRMFLLRTPEARARLMPLLSPDNRGKTAGAPLVAIAAADLRFHDYLPVLHPDPPDLKQRYEGDADKDARRANAARLNAILQVGYFIVGIRAAGLAVLPMTGFDVAATDAAFFPDGRYRSLTVLNIGRPGPHAWGERLPRLEYEDAVISL